MYKITRLECQNFKKIERKISFQINGTEVVQRYDNANYIIPNKAPEDLFR